MPTFIRVLASKARAFLYPDALDADFEQELESHLRMAEEELLRSGVSAAEARKRARQELGGVTQLCEAGREVRGLPWLEAYWLDVKLGLRMLRKTWGLTLVGGLAMTVVIGIGVVGFAIAELQFLAKLPLDEGKRVVALQTWDERAGGRAMTSMEDFERWRQQLRSVEDVGAFQTIERKLQIGHSGAEPVLVAQMTASGFRLARVGPALGRTFVDEDEMVGAPPVVVISHDSWMSRFAGDAAAVGRTVRLGETVHTVVGVMPEGFGFPLNNRYWVPLPNRGVERLEDNDGFGVVFGRLVADFQIEEASAELATLGLLSDVLPSQQLRARIVPYTLAFAGDVEQGEVRWVMRLVLLFAVLLLIPPCANVAILVYARTVSRQGEFAARFALGASRRRIIAQLFVEMLVLTGASALVSLLLARAALGWAEATLREAIVDGPPFWMDFSLSGRTVLFASGLATVAALIAALVPALKATGREMQSGLRALGGRAGMRLGTVWTVLVIAQVALTLAVLPWAVEIGWGTVRQGILGPGFAAEKYLTARVVVDPSEGNREGSRLAAETAVDSSPPEPSGAGQPSGLNSELVAGMAVQDPDRSPAHGPISREWVRQLGDQAGVLGVTLAEAEPGGGSWRKIEVEGVVHPEGGLLSSVNLVRVNRVDDRFFGLFEFQFLTGRDFAPSDLSRNGAGGASTAVVVDQTFVSQLLGNENPLGLRLRFLPSRAQREEALANLVELAPEPWLEIVGVVADRPANGSSGSLYLPLPSSAGYPVSVVALVNGTAADHAVRLRELLSQWAPSLKLETVLSLDEIYSQRQVGNNIGASSLAAVTLSVLLLSVAGIYALMSFAVNQRRKEIGIRSALGAQPVHLLSGVFRKAVGQVATGAILGVLLALALDYYLPAESVGGWNVPGVIPAAAAFMMIVALAAAAGPARRALRVQPIDELREG